MPRGRDILAACGQLKSASLKLSARERMVDAAGADPAAQPPTP
jgi:23S rRNA (adenine2503-C2)-methyltransferase